MPSGVYERKSNGLCDKCKGKPRPAGHTGMHTGMGYRFTSKNKDKKVVSSKDKVKELTSYYFALSLVNGSPPKVLGIAQSPDEARALCDKTLNQLDVGEPGYFLILSHTESGSTIVGQGDFIRRVAWREEREDEE